MITTNWTEVLDDLVCEAIIAGRVRGQLHGAPTETFESGLAHIFFTVPSYISYPKRPSYSTITRAPTVDLCASD